MRIAATTQAMTMPAMAPLLSDELLELVDSWGRWTWAAVADNDCNPLREGDAERRADVRAAGLAALLLTADSTELTEELFVIMTTASCVELSRRRPPTIVKNVLATGVPSWLAMTGRTTVVLTALRLTPLSVRVVLT